MNERDKPTLTRRSFAFGLGATALGVGTYKMRRGLEQMIPLEGQSATRAFEKYTSGRGFKPITEKSFKELIPHTGDIWLPSPKKEYLADGSLQYHLNLPNQETTILAQITVPQNPNVSLSLFEATVDKDRFQVPIIRSEQHRSTRFSLGPQSGEKLLTISRTDFSGDIMPEDIRLDLFELYGSPVHRSIIESIPLLGMNPQYDASGEFTTEMPIATQLQLWEHKDGRIMAIYFRIADEELAGSTLEELVTKYGRPIDIDPEFFLTMTPDGKTIEIAHQQDVNGQTHQIIVDKYYSNPVNPYQLELHSVGHHGMVNLGRSSERVFTMVPLMPDFGDSTDYDLQRAQYIISYRLHAQQARQNINMLEYKSGLVFNLNQYVNEEKRLRFAQKKLRELGAN